MAPQSMRNRHLISPLSMFSLEFMKTFESRITTLPRIGVLGGMGPLATADFMAKLVYATPAAHDQDHFPVSVDSTPQIPDRVAALEGRGRDPLAHLVAAARRLQATGCDLIAMPCNTAHLWHARLVAQTALPLMHIVDAVDAELGAVRKVGLLGTTATLEHGLYQRHPGVDRHWVLPDMDVMRDLVMPGIAAVKLGDTVAAARLLRSAARKLASNGAEAIVLACTEIPLALTAEDVPVRMVDATFALARHTIAAARSIGASAVARAARNRATLAGHGIQVA